MNSGEKTMDARRLRHGKGTYEYQYSGFVYKGEWREGVSCGGLPFSFAWVPGAAAGIASPGGVVSNGAINSPGLGR